MVQKKEYTIYYSGLPDRSGQKGTGFWVNKRRKGSILGFEAINERICKLRMKGKYNNISLISAYAPTETGDELEIDTFYHIRGCL